MLKKIVKFTHHPKRDKSGFSWVMMLGSLFAIPAISGDMYLPSLPALTQEMHTTELMAQLTFTTTMLGGVVGQLVVGPILDRFGRKRPVMVGLLGHVLMSIACALSTHIWQLIIFRFFQGVCNASANITGMAVHRDVFSGVKAVQIMSRLMLVVGVAPLFAPSIGTFLIHFGGWRMVFVVLAIIGAILLVCVYLFLPETLERHNRLYLSIKKSIKLYAKVLSDRQFAILAIVGGLSQAFMMAWVVTSPFITQVQWGFSSTLFSICFAINGCALVIGAQINSFLVKYFESRKLLIFALLFRSLMSVIMILVSIATVNYQWTLLIPFILGIFVHNSITANAFVIAVKNHKRQAGTASAVIGICNSLFPAILSPIVSVLGNDSFALSISCLFLCVMSITLLAMFTKIFFDPIKLPNAPEM